MPESMHQNPLAKQFMITSMMKSMVRNASTCSDVAQTADQASVKSNYKRLAKIKHPDKSPTNPNATRDFQLVRAGLPATPKDSMCALIIDA
ncbi:hypothetical protein CIRG_08072 [Coccidioides immitis RMSCC 2394]|uniref:J domain-containing protein n=1 Tax=Coccidioides immitis RMSCC 2394 TaxID=404692 RepID=A0A0J6YI85_COCIT|nr:hypothetical protein CIRG_08072 [Coccidioides immitis RMSCC 2394]